MKQFFNFSNVYKYINQTIGYNNRSMNSVQKLMSELEKRETQFSSVLDRGESLIISHHPASQVPVILG